MAQAMRWEAGAAAHPQRPQQPALFAASPSTCRCRR
jgi:hypothetical protein